MTEQLPVPATGSAPVRLEPTDAGRGSCGIRIEYEGGRCVLGFQSIAQVANTDGAGEARTIVENCGNTLILRCSTSEHGGTPASQASSSVSAKSSAAT